MIKNLSKVLSSVNLVTIQEKQELLMRTLKREILLLLQSSLTFLATT